MMTARSPRPQRNPFACAPSAAQAPHAQIPHARAPHRRQVHVLIDEDVHVAYSSALGRQRWEEATFTFRSVLVTGGGRPSRRYEQGDAWDEAVADPREGYVRVAGKLKRHAEAGRDYDPKRHLTSR